LVDVKYSHLQQLKNMSMILIEGAGTFEWYNHQAAAGAILELE
jgi:hypothetical protein